MNLLAPFQHINTFIFDINGVFTSNALIINRKGESLYNIYNRDGYAVNRALRKGYRVAIISAGGSKSVAEWLKKWGVTDIYMRARYKMEAYEEFVSIYDLSPQQILYMGDNFPDVEVLQRVGIPTCPADAIPEVQAIAHYISPFKGGQGCVNDVIEKTMRLQGTWGRGKRD